MSASASGPSQSLIASPMAATAPHAPFRGNRMSRLACASTKRRGIEHADTKPINPAQRELKQDRYELNRPYTGILNYDSGPGPSCQILAAKRLELRIQRTTGWRVHECPRFQSSPLSGTLVCELRKRGTSQLIDLVWLWFRSPHLGLSGKD